MIKIIITSIYHCYYRNLYCAYCWGYQYVSSKQFWKGTECCISFLHSPLTSLFIYKFWSKWFAFA